MTIIEKIEISGTKLDPSKVIGSGPLAQATLETILLLQRQRLGIHESVDLTRCELTSSDFDMMRSI